MSSREKKDEARRQASRKNSDRGPAGIRWRLPGFICQANDSESSATPNARIRLMPISWGSFIASMPATFIMLVTAAAIKTNATTS